MLFVLTNAYWYKHGEDPIFIKDLHCYDLETDKLTIMGPIAHHPSWHQSEPWAVSFVEEGSFPDRLEMARTQRELGITKLCDDGTVVREFDGHIIIPDTLDQTQTLSQYH